MISIFNVVIVISSLVLLYFSFTTFLSIIFQITVFFHKIDTQIEKNITTTLKLHGVNSIVKNTTNSGFNHYFQDCDTIHFKSRNNALQVGYSSYLFNGIIGVVMMDRIKSFSNILTLPLIIIVKEGYHDLLLKENCITLDLSEGFKQAKLKHKTIIMKFIQKCLLFNNNLISLPNPIQLKKPSNDEIERFSSLIKRSFDPIIITNNLSEIFPREKNVIKQCFKKLGIKVINYIPTLTISNISNIHDLIILFGVNYKILNSINISHTTLALVDQDINISKQNKKINTFKCCPYLMLKSIYHLDIVQNPVLIDFNKLEEINDQYDSKYWVIGKRLFGEDKNYR